MSRELTKSLLEEVSAIVSEKKFAAGMTLIEMRWEIGEAIVGHVAWKNKKNHAALLKYLAEELNLGERSLYYCVSFYEKYPTAKDFETVLQSTQPSHKLPVWRDFVKELPAAPSASHPTTKRCHHCPLHCK